MRFCASDFVLLAATLGFASSAPTSFPQLTGCNVSHEVIPLPAGQTTLVAPTDAQPAYIAVGFGTQNYSCTAGKYRSIGALAELFDASCIYDAIKHSPSVVSTRSALGYNPPVLGHHYFVKNPVPGSTGIVPKFDFTSDSQKGDPNAYVVLTKEADIPSPTNPTRDVDWLELAAIPGQGDLAKYVFRIDTFGGQPPSSCTSGSLPIGVPYAAFYWLFK